MFAVYTNYAAAFIWTLNLFVPGRSIWLLLMIAAVILMHLFVGTVMFRRQPVYGDILSAVNAGVSEYKRRRWVRQLVRQSTLPF